MGQDTREDTLTHSGERCAYMQGRAAVCEVAGPLWYSMHRRAPLRPSSNPLEGVCVYNIAAAQQLNTYQTTPTQPEDPNFGLGG
eukprot:3133966-Pyramimonas_sp.AAC.1